MAGGCPASSSETVKFFRYSDRSLCRCFSHGMATIAVLGFTAWYGGSHGTGIHGLVWRQSRYWDSRLAVVDVSIWRCDKTSGEFVSHARIEDTSLYDAAHSPFLHRVG